MEHKAVEAAAKHLNEVQDIIQAVQSIDKIVWIVLIVAAINLLISLRLYLGQFQLARNQVELAQKIK